MNTDKNVKKNGKKNFNFKQKKNNAIQSLKEVETFLRKSNSISKYLKLYKNMKKGAK